VARFQRLVAEALGGIEARGHRGLIVGGTGLYHRAVIDKLDLPGRYPEVRAALEEEAKTDEGLAHLYARLRALDPVAAAKMEATNGRRIVRALEVTIGASRPFSTFGPGLTHYGPTRFVTVGLFVNRAELDRRIGERLDRQLDEGFAEEAEALVERPGGLSRTARQALGYKELFAYLGGECTLAEARARIIRRSKALARRQEAWFRRDPRIAWLDATQPDLLAVFSTVVSAARGRFETQPARD
jgi:tRNA dimethylallyltransferase